jgi:hypothetical protein
MCPGRFIDLEAIGLRMKKLLVGGFLLNMIVKISLCLTYSNSIKIAIKDKPSGGASVLHVLRPSHRFGGDWVTNEEVVSGVIFAKYHKISQ